MQTKVLTMSKRRCCLCFGLNHSEGIKKGQIAHLDGNSANTSFENLAFLCFEHHDELDSRTSQSKNFTLSEVKFYRNSLYEKLHSGMSPAKKIASSSNSCTPKIKAYWNGSELNNNLEVIFDLRTSLPGGARQEIGLDFNIQDSHSRLGKNIPFGFIIDPFITEIPDWGGGYPDLTVLPDGRHLFQSQKMILNNLAGSWQKYRFTLNFQHHAVNELIETSIQFFNITHPNITFKIRILGVSSSKSLGDLRF